MPRASWVISTLDAVAPAVLEGFAAIGRLVYRHRSFVSCKQSMLR
jgi:hypothetical protein